ncbi:hypothetical protein A0H76_2390 [Hepatospora eriocheir]|uniref:Uncharacterized protein n=1 Tax=Hepatospora eriocheir TaxID=1081669 RepID=A0A1X0QLC0_9MICR|nr:hypothetical protein A0H76_2390 [Hepatospora eriocheir]
MKRAGYEIIEQVINELQQDLPIHNIDIEALNNFKEDWISGFENLQHDIVSKMNESNKDSVIYDDELLDDYIESRNSLEFSDELSYDEFDNLSEEREIKKAEKSNNTYLIGLYVKINKVKDRFHCTFKDGFINSNGLHDIPFKGGTGTLDWEKH